MTTLDLSFERWILSCDDSTYAEWCESQRVQQERAELQQGVGEIHFVSGWGSGRFQAEHTAQQEILQRYYVNQTDMLQKFFSGQLGGNPQQGPRPRGLLGSLGGGLFGG